MTVRALAEPPPNATARKSCGCQKRRAANMDGQKFLATRTDVRMILREREKNGVSY